MWGLKKTLFLTGANGLVGRILYHAFKSAYHLILFDNKIGKDPYNRYGLEKTDINIDIPENAVHKIDLSTEKGKFSAALSSYKPACVLHLAGLLENQEAPLIQEKNRLIHDNVLSACFELNVPVISMSSIMVFYGAAMKSPLIRGILAGKNDLKLSEAERLSTKTPLDNRPDNIKTFNPDDFEKILAYIKSKEYLESIAYHYAANNPAAPMVAIRLGWVTVKNPFELEYENTPKYSEITVCLDKEDMIRAMRAIIEAILAKRITGYHCYPLISEHPQRWISLQSIKNELGWEPRTQILERYAQKNKTQASSEPAFYK